ncbi:DUF397 domain-containing protein [Pseudonocardia sp. MH-G8]|uniref:DUF397 domain-containing protein n=1 Tax=Pseudonocardia sp. MH-G8 TaxID=1854588 RepID=UPI000B9FA25F|nr:DUF397 domain-containing protein [Pseudonocardia sp. MH-G8]OZM82307.1 DUF397 domain-containing protein [Pseudonocardia sp. MH-G8]
MITDPGPRWRKSKASQGNGNCVEMAALPDGRVGVRDSKDPSGPVLTFTRAELRAWLHGARSGEFDDLT